MCSKHHKASKHKTWEASWKLYSLLRDINHTDSRWCHNNEVYFFEIIPKMVRPRIKIFSTFETFESFNLCLCTVGLYALKMFNFHATKNNPKKQNRSKKQKMNMDIKWTTWLSIIRFTQNLEYMFSSQCSHEALKGIFKSICFEVIYFKTTSLSLILHNCL